MKFEELTREQNLEINYSENDSFHEALRDLKEKTEELEKLTTDLEEKLENAPEIDMEELEKMCSTSEENKLERWRLLLDKAADFIITSFKNEVVNDSKTFAEHISGIKNDMVKSGYNENNILEKDIINYGLLSTIQVISEFAAEILPSSADEIYESAVKSLEEEMAE